MNQIGTKLLCLAIVGLGLSSRAVTPENRYDTIVDRNIFRLTSPPIATNAPPPDPALDKNIELSGISNINGKKKAWFIVKQAKPGPKDLPQYLSLGENERQDFLEVISISEEKGEVQIKNSENPMILSFENNKPKVAPGSTPTPMATAATSVVSPQSPNPYSYNSPNPPGRSVTVTGGVAPITPANNENGLRSIPSRPVRLSPIPANQQPTASTEPAAVDPVTQRAMMEIQQAQAAKTGQKLPPLPPLPQ
jgi:hypothetical protein